MKASLEAWLRSYLSIGITGNLELMIFTKELPESFFDDLSNLNPNVTIIIDWSFKTTIEKLSTN